MKNKSEWARVADKYEPEAFAKAERERAQQRRHSVRVRAEKYWRDNDAKQ